MRTYGRLLKNIAGLALLAALISLLLPFCRFSAEGQEITLSGMDVAKAAVRAGSAYLSTGTIEDSFVLKAPVTVGVVKSGLTYAQGAGMTRVLVLCAVAVLVPLILGVLAMVMLFLAEGKKTMVFPTLFTAVIVLELAFVFVCLPALKLFFKTGIYLYALLVVAAFAAILLGWITGGYRKPDPEEDGGQRDNPGEHSGGRDRRSRSRWPRRKSRRGKKNKKKRGRKSSGNQKKSKNQTKDTDSQKPEDQKTRQENANTYEWKDCQISYDGESRMYRIVNQSVDDVLLFKEEQMIEVLRPGDRVRVERPVTLQVQGTRDRLRLK